MWIAIKMYHGQDVQKYQAWVTMICLIFVCLDNLDINLMNCNTMESTIDFFCVNTLKLYCGDEYFSFTCN